MIRLLTLNPRSSDSSFAVGTSPAKVHGTPNSVRVSSLFTPFNGEVSPLIKSLFRRHSTKAQAGDLTANLHLSPNLKAQYSEIIPVLHGQGQQSSLTLLGRRRDDPSKLDTLLSQPWQPGEPVQIVWQDASKPSTA